MKTLLTTLNAKYIHKNLALRWLYIFSPYKEECILKEFTIKDKIDSIVKNILELNCDMIMFSIYIWNIEETKQVIQKIREVNKKVKILVGGPEVSFESFELLNLGIDAISLGEGEHSVWEYVTMLKENKSYEIEGIYTLDYPNKIFRKEDLKVHETLNADPYFLDFDLNDLDKRYFYFETSRGCPYGCEYCLSSTDRKVRMFSDEYVLNILDKISKSKVKQVKFLDRTFNVKPDRALKIARFINENCKNQIFQFEIVAETLSDELLDFFLNEADPNRFRFEVGVQSFNSCTLKEVGRLQNNERLKEVITKMRNANLVLHVDLIAGLPLEDFNSFKDSFNELFALNASELQLGILKLLKGTSLRRKKDIYDFTFSDIAPYTVESTKWLSKEELVILENTANAVEKYWNHGRCAYSISKILELGYYSNPFDLFKDLGFKLSRLKRPYQVHELFMSLLELLPDNEIVEGIILTDYYKGFKQKPKRFYENKINEELRKDIYDCVIESGLETKENLYRYAVCTIGYKEECGYQVIVYNALQTLPKRLFIDKNLRKVSVL